jgi:YVTN family beta-propeller protein
MRLPGRTIAPSAPFRILTTVVTLALAICFAACGETYRPVAQPLEGIQPSPAAAHSIISINTDGIANDNRGNGSASNINVSGDSVQGNLIVGLAPAHAAVTPNGTKLYVANSGEDSVTANTTSTPSTVAATVSLPASPGAQITQVTGSGSTATYTYSGTGLFSTGDTVFVTGCATAGFNGAFTVTAASGNTFSVANSTSGTDNPEFPGAQAKTPNAVFIGTADNNNVYVAGYSTNSVYVVNTSTSVVSMTVPVGAHPVALAELPNDQQIYVANQGSGTVSVISTVNDTVTQTISPAAGAVPVWAAAKTDSTRVYVLDANGTVYSFDPLVAAVNCGASPPVGCAATATTNAGGGSNYLTFDPILDRLYVTNPANSEIAILDASVNPPKLMNTINLSTAAASVCTSCAPTSVSVLGDGSRAYVAAYQFAPGCTDTSGNSVNCVNTLVAVIDGPSATLRSVISGMGSAAALSTTGCGPGSGPAPAIWQPGTARFRVSIASSGGGSNSNFKVDVGQCDAGSVAVINTYPVNGNAEDTYSGVSLNAPLSTFPPLAGGVPPPQNPVFVVAGP